jgi:hypothetical protein
MKCLVRTSLFIATVLTLAVVVHFVLAAQSSAGDKHVVLTGTVSDSMCGAKHMTTGDNAKCARSCVKGGAQYSLVVSDHVYAMDEKKEELEKLAGQTVTVTGSLSGSVLHVHSVEPAKSSVVGSAQPTSDIPPPIAIVEGLVRDVACPIQNKEATATKFNLKCAEDCARLGSPLIVLTQDGVLYTPISELMPDKDQRQRLMPFLGKYVRVTGPIFERNGTHAIAIRTIEELKNVHLITNAE